MQIRRFLFTLFALVALSPFLAAQAKVSGTIPSTGGGASCVSINVDAQATVAVQVTGTWTGTLQPKLSIQGQTAANIQVTPSTSSTPASTITANGVYRSSVAGGSTFQLCGATVASGTANVYLNSSTASAGSGSGGAVTFPLVAPSGSDVAPSYAFSSGTWGWYFQPVAGGKTEGLVLNTSTNSSTSQPLVEITSPDRIQNFTGIGVRCDIGPPNLCGEYWILGADPTVSTSQLSAGIGNCAGGIANGGVLCIDDSALGDHASIIWPSTATIALSVSALGANTCRVQSAGVGISGAVTTNSVVVWGYAGSPAAVTGYGTGGLQVSSYATANTANVMVCNITAGSITPGAISVNVTAMGH
jgi:hypothetical protein